MSHLKIRLADWRDRGGIQPLRRLIRRPMDGGLYELLNWPMYHCHVAAVTDPATGHDRVVGFSAVVLHLHGVADDVGTVVDPEYRARGIATALRGTQVRDLSLMGLSALFCAAPMSNPAAIRWCTRIFGAPIAAIDSAYLAPHCYFGSIVPALEATLKQMGTPDPYPLSAFNLERLLHKYQRAVKESAQLEALGDFNVRKALIRQAL